MNQGLPTKKSTVLKNFFQISVDKSYYMVYNIIRTKI